MKELWIECKSVISLMLGTHYQDAVGRASRRHRHEDTIAVGYGPPPVVGCTLSLEEEWNCRWKAQCPRATPPFSFSDGCHFDPADEIGQRRALMHALRWLWNSHAELTGEACPYELDV